MRPRNIASFLKVFLLSTIVVPAFADEIVTHGANINADVSRLDGRIAMGLLGSIWILPANGGQATLATDGLQQASRPRWSPDGRRILYQTASLEGISLWLLDIQSSTSSRVSAAALNNQFASWHPQGERVVYSSSRNGTDFDLWETDLPTGLSWRIGNEPGDEFEPVWSANGRDLAYIRKFEGQFSLMVRRHGRPVLEMLASTEPLSSLAWRPDGTLLTYLRGSGDQTTSEMAILSEPLLIREFANDEDFSASPVSWRNRSQHIYAADGMIKTRTFGDSRSKPVPFRAFVASPEARPPRTVTQRQLPLMNPPQERLVIRGARLFDGIWSDYRENVDVLVDGGRIAAVEPRTEWPDATILDLGNVTILPGFIDTWSSMPAGPQSLTGLTLLAYGVTTIISDQLIDSFDQQLWEGAESPGPRLLPALNLASGENFDNVDAFYLANISSPQPDQSETINLVRRLHDSGIPVVAENWITHVNADSDMLLGIESLPHSSLDDRYQEYLDDGKTIVTSRETVTVISGLADAATPGLDALLRSRQAQELRQTATPARRHSVLPHLATASASILLGSKPNGLPAGLALHAELRALQAAGLSGEQVMHTAGKNPAKALGLENQVGTITPGALADLILVAGDPLDNVEDALNIVAVVRNGRFFSLVRLLEQAGTAIDVE